MKNINWKVRLRSKPFLTAVASLLGMVVVDLGVVDMGTYETYVDAVFVALMAGGIVVDPTTEGMEDSEQAKSYTSPRKD